MVFYTPFLPEPNTFTDTITSPSTATFTGHSKNGIRDGRDTAFKPVPLAFYGYGGVHFRTDRRGPCGMVTSYRAFGSICAFAIYPTYVSTGSTRNVQISCPAPPASVVTRTTSVGSA